MCIRTLPLRGQSSSPAALASTEPPMPHFGPTSGTCGVLCDRSCRTCPTAAPHPSAVSLASCIARIPTEKCTLCDYYRQTLHKLTYLLYLQRFSLPRLYSSTAVYLFLVPLCRSGAKCFLRFFAPRFTTCVVKSGDGVCSCVKH